MNSQTNTSRKILLTGATGYVGGRLLPRLVSRGHDVRCLTRRESGRENFNLDEVEVSVGNVLNMDSLLQTLEGIHTAYYFIHSMGDSEDFEKTDRKAAENFAEACSRQNVKRIVYLGGLGNEADDLSKHLRSRQEIGDVLRTSTAQVVEFQASIIIGSGSLSFEMIRALVERLPVMICPKWVRVLAQPIAIEDVLAYLVEVLDKPVSDSRIYEIGGPDAVSYGDIMQRYADQRRLTRYMIPVPFLTPYLSSLWLGLVTPLYSRVGRKLIDSLRNETLVTDDSAAHEFSVVPRSVDEAISRALVNEDSEFAETRWSDAFSSGGEQKSWGGVRFGSRLVDSRCREVPLTAAEAFAPIRRIGGSTGWYYGDWLWKIRGFMDLLVGGVGVRRGRRDPENVRSGDTLDFWRVEEVVPDKLLRLAAEMRVPGRAWLEFEVTEEEGKTTVRQTAIFDPVGLFGILYWYSLFPLHEFVFRGMLRNICKAAVGHAERVDSAKAA
ncbi:SDR family oxidoreductase [Mariniblastus fucicola]|uniref:NAD dependent epimerase/dehydratase family protein n=1 Tax=Mariniblastus fucicola TaxID=980251 RepID=A0A5B9PQB5_9BACT|nr:SDR family oxidoreductase [Mariniblastus fucicola]QEG24661.1 NAD dependent epimerase/dehydratase family protein [Mariniblastus fucicola]